MRGKDGIQFHHRCYFTAMRLSACFSQLFIFITYPQMFAFHRPERCQFNFTNWNCFFLSFRMTNFIAQDNTKQGPQEAIWPDHPTAPWIKCDVF